MKRKICAALALCALVLSSPAFAQQTTGNITGRITDDQNAAIPGVTVTGKNTETGFVRTGVTDGEGIYRLSAMPVGTYDITAELQGFSKIESKGIVLNVGQTLDIPVTLKVATLSESVEVRGETPMVERTSSAVGGVVDMERIESMPLNGRQFANAAITIPGVGLGFHSDPTKSTQYSPQIAGGNGRNVNYQIDGGDNNDDTVGGLLQLYPLEAIQEFNFVTQRYKAEYGRSNGGVMNIVTKSGTNQMRGSWFTSLRDKRSERRDDDREDQQRRQAALSPLPVRRLVRRADHPESRALLRRLRAHAAGYAADGDDARAVPGPRRRVPDAEPREPLHRQGLEQPHAVAVRFGALRPQHQLAGLQRGDAVGAGELGRQRQLVQLDQPEPQLGAGRFEAERVHLPVRRLREPHRLPHDRAAADIPERREHRLQHQHAADDRAAQVPVPRRLLLARDGEGRTRPRHEGRRQLHPRAETVRHLQLGQRRLRLHDARQRPQRQDQPRHPEQAGILGEPADGPVRLLHPGRLARD